MCADRISSTAGTDPHQLIGLQDQVRDRPLTAGRGLVQHHPGVREQGALARRARREQHRADADGLADAGGRDRRVDVLDMVPYTASMDGRSPPSQLMYRLISWSALSASRCSSWAMSVLATPESIAVPMRLVSRCE